MEHEFRFKTIEDQESIVGINDKTGKLEYIAEKAYEKVLGTELIKKDYGFDLISHLSQVINYSKSTSLKYSKLQNKIYIKIQDKY